MSVIIGYIVGSCEAMRIMLSLVVSFLKDDSYLFKDRIKSKREFC